MANPLTIESIEQAALQLQPDARVQLTHFLVQSLASLPEAEFADLWLAEAERRDAEMDSGKVVGIPGEEVFHRIRARYNK
ncbi:MAG: addiction module protein [Pseudomonadota bacterium]|nr:addiction module protein [Pseudomonadota bacterium]MDP1904309.1 addiction module protein [Pseudomonadota bacterium]MDP2354296.1 addiction module protein [Pseudomonadota bacterium]